MTPKQHAALRLNHSKMQLTSALGHLRFLLIQYSNCKSSWELDLNLLEEHVRHGLQEAAKKQGIKGNYLENLPFEKTQIGKRAKQEI